MAAWHFEQLNYELFQSRAGVGGVGGVGGRWRLVADKLTARERGRIITAPVTLPNSEQLECRSHAAKPTHRCIQRSSTSFTWNFLTIFCRFLSHINFIHTFCPNWKMFHLVYFTRYEIFIYIFFFFLLGVRIC